MFEMPFVRVLEMNIRQNFVDSITEHIQDRVDGFRITSPILLERSTLVTGRFGVSEAYWDSTEHVMTLGRIEGDMNESYKRREIFDCAMGSLDIRKCQWPIKTLHLGLDFHHNPVCFMAGYPTVGHCSLIPSGPLRDDSSDVPLWSELVDEIAIEVAPDLWTLKGDRIQGLHAWIGLCLDIRPGEPGIIILAEIRISRGHHWDALVWDVDISDCSQFKV